MNDPGRFPALTAGLAAAQRADDEAQAAVATHQNSATRAQADIQAAQAGKDPCPKCGGEVNPKTLLCPQATCDGKLVQLGFGRGVGIALAGGLTAIVVATLDRDLKIFTSGGDASVFVALITAMVLSVSLLIVVRLRQASRRQVVTAERRRAAEKLQAERIADAQNRLDEARRRAATAAEAAKPFRARLEQAQRQLQNARDKALQTIRQAKLQAEQALAAAQSRLQAARNKALVAWDAEHPAPALSQGVRPEAYYAEHSHLKLLTGRGWRIAHDPDGPLTMPKGLVTKDAPSSPPPLPSRKSSPPPIPSQSGGTARLLQVGRVWNQGRQRFAEGQCPHCKAMAAFSRPDTTFWADCPRCHQKIWLD